MKWIKLFESFNSLELCLAKKIKKINEKNQII